MQGSDHRRTAVRCAALVSLLGGAAHADPDDKSRRRLVHLTIAAGLGATRLATETVLKPMLAPAQCRWCDAPGFDTSVRNAVVWHDTATADLLSNIDVYALAPAVG